jgi:flagellar motor protein MotB
MNQSEYLNESHLESAEIPEKPAFSHSIKIEQTSKGSRVTVHVSANNFADARYEAVDLFKKVQEDLILEGIPLAPIESKNGVKVNG